MKATPFITWLGGDCCTPKALLKRDRTTTIFINDDKIITINGKRASKLKTEACVINDGLLKF